MADKKNWVQRLADGMDLAAEPLPGCSVVELAGSQRVIIERHGGVTEYSRCAISVKVSYGQVRICGCNLELTRMSRDQLVISGCIDCVQLCRRNG